MLPIILPDGYQYVIAALAFTPWLLTYQTFVVVKHRRLAKIKYPQAYAELAQTAASPEAQKFNCAQRAHHNTLEALPMLFVSTLIAGLRYPILTAILCGLFSLGRIGYTIGYSTGNPENRRIGGNLAAVGVHALVFISTYNAYKFVTAGL